MELRILFLWCSEKSNFKQKVSTRVDQNNVENSRKKYVTWTCFKFWPVIDIFRKLEANKSLIMSSLQITKNKLSFGTLHRVNSNTREVFTSWLNKYSKLKTSCHMKPKYFLWTKLLENLLLAKYFTFVAATLKEISNVLDLVILRINI